MDEPPPPALKQLSGAAAGQYVSAVMSAFAGASALASDVSTLPEQPCSAVAPPLWRAPVALPPQPPSVGRSQGLWPGRADERGHLSALCSVSARTAAAAAEAGRSCGMDAAPRSIWRRCRTCATQSACSATVQCTA